MLKDCRLHRPFHGSCLTFKIFCPYRMCTFDNLQVDIQRQVGKSKPYIMHQTTLVLGESKASHSYAGLGGRSIV